MVPMDGECSAGRAAEREEHWKHLRTTNVVESPFASVRLRTGAAKRFKTGPNATGLIWKVLILAERRFRRLDAPESPTVPVLQAAAKVKIVGLVVSVDRMERGTGQKTALVEAQESFGLQAHCNATLRDIVLHLHNRPVDGRIVLGDDMRARMEAYARKYGFEI